MGAGLINCIILAQRLRNDTKESYDPGDTPLRGRFHTIHGEIEYRQDRAKARVLRDLKPYDILTEQEDSHAAQATHLLARAQLATDPELKDFGVLVQTDEAVAVVPGMIFLRDDWVTKVYKRGLSFVKHADGRHFVVDVRPHSYTMITHRVGTGELQLTSVVT
jgi:hypothetical protein